MRNRPNRFIVILGGKHPNATNPGPTIQRWADSVHFPCRPGFNTVGVDGLRVDG